MKTTHTPGPWIVLPCPVHAGKHPLHDQRWIATADATVEWNIPNTDWRLATGSLIAMMRDGPLANAQLIAAAPELLAALRDLLPHAHAERESIRGDARHSDDPDFQEALVTIDSQIVRAEDAILKAGGTL